MKTRHFLCDTHCHLSLAGYIQLSILLFKKGSKFQKKIVAKFKAKMTKCFGSLKTIFVLSAQKRNSLVLATCHSYLAVMGALSLDKEGISFLLHGQNIDLNEIQRIFINIMKLID